MTDRQLEALRSSDIGPSRYEPKLDRAGVERRRISKAAAHDLIGEAIERHRALAWYRFYERYDDICDPYAPDG